MSKERKELEKEKAKERNRTKRNNALTLGTIALTVGSIFLGKHLKGNKNS